MPAIPMPDPETEKFLDDARSQAAASLKGRFPDSMLAPPPPAEPRVQNSVTNNVTGGAPQQALPPAEPGPDSQAVVDSSPVPTPESVPVVDKTGYWDDLKRNAKDLDQSMGDAVMRAAAATARTLGWGVATLARGAATQAQAEGGGDMGPNPEDAASDAVFDFIKKHIETKYDAYKQDPNASAPAQFIGNATEGLAPIATGPAAVPIMISNAVTEKGKQSIDAGDNTKTAMTLALINGMTTTAQLKVGFRDPSLVKRIAKWVGVGDVLDVAGKATEVLTRHILQDESYQEALKKVDPLNPTDLTVNTLMQTIFALLHKPNIAKLAKKADETAKPPDLEADEQAPPPGPAGTGTPPPPPVVPPTPAPEAVPVKEPIAAKAPLPTPDKENIQPSSAAADANIAAAAEAGKKGPTKKEVVPDKPTAEPPSDLKAQVADMKSPDTDRKHVYLSKDNVDNLGGMDGVKKLADGAVVTNNFDRNGGALISVNHSERSKATALRKKNGDDMQATLGALTGAGEGKAPEQTQVVQGQTPEGAVVKESAVAPADVPAAVQAVQDAGQTPVVTTHEEALGRREAMVAHEKSLPPEPAPEAVPVIDSKPAEEVPSKDSEPAAEAPLKKGDRRVVRVGKEDVPVVVDGPAVGNKVPVRTLDDEGRLSKDVRNVPAELFKKGSEEPVKADNEPAKAEADIPQESKPGDTEAQDLLDRFNAAETPPPGKTYPASVTDRAYSIGETARAIKKLAGKDGVDPKVASDAIEAANEVARLDLKSPEAMAKGQGISHKVMDIRARELKRVLNNLIGKEPPKFNEAPVQPKAEKLLAKIKKERVANGLPTDEQMRDAGLTQSEIERMKRDPDMVKAQQIKDGYRYIAGEWRQGNEEDVRLYRQGSAANKAEVLKNKARLDAYWKMREAGGKDDGSLSNILGSDWSGHGKDLKEQSYDALAQRAADWRGREADKIEKEIADRKAKTTKAEELKAKEAAKKEPKVSSGIKDVVDETKPLPEKVLNAGEKAKIGAAIDRYNRVGDLDVQDAHDNLERILHEIYGPARREAADNILHLAREQREDMRAAESPKRMSDTVDDEDLKGQDYDPNEEDTYKDDHYNDVSELHPEVLRQMRELADSSPMGALHNALNGTGFWTELGRVRDKGGFVSTHKMLDHLIKVSKSIGNEHMHTLLSKLREKAPDLPIRPVDEVIDPGTGKRLGGAGAHDPNNRVIQVKISQLGSQVDREIFHSTHAIVHEIVHGATSYELYNNPNGQFAKDVGALLEEARTRAAKLGMDDGRHYGLKDAHEFVAEALSNPVFQDFLAYSDRANSKYKAKWGFLDNTFGRLARAIGKMLGYKGTPKLLSDALKTIGMGMDAQKRWMPEKSFLRDMRPAVRERLRNQSRLPDEDHMPGLDERIHELNQLGEPPPGMQHEEEFRGVVGNNTTEVAKLFRRAVRSGAVETIRRTVRALTPYDGLVRAALRRGVFGHNDATNPLRHYDNLVQERNAIINRMAHSAEGIVNDRARLSYTDNKALGQFQQDVTKARFSVETPKANQATSVMADKKFNQKWDDIQARWKNLTPEQKDIYRRERDWNEKAIRANRKAAVDVALDSFSDQDIPKAKRQLLYSVTEPRSGFDELIGKGKEIDVGDRNDSLKESLKDLASTSELEGDYFHLGRHGDHVVQITPEGTKVFNNQAGAEAYAEKIRALSPRSKAKVAEVGGKWQVDYKAEYVSMHNSPAEADAEVERLRNEGYDVGSVTQKILSEKNAPLSTGMQNIVAEASRRLGDDEAGKDLKESLRNAFVNLMAARSAYAGSKLARRNVGGVKSEEMGRNFATHAQSLAWNTGHLSTVFKVGEALGKLREATKDASQPQGTASQRGRVYDEIQRRLRQETEQYGSHQPFNSAVAKLGFLNYMTSASHALIYLTQNFSTAIPKAGARFGYGKSMGAFAHAMTMISGPAFRETYRAALMQKGANVDSIQNAILAAVAKDARFGKWAQGGKDSPLQQLIDRGIIHTSLSNQMATVAKGGSPYVNRVMQWARILPSMADMFNRVSTGLAALELHKGDVYRAGDFVRETHIDYSQENKSRAFRAVGRVWGGNSVTMFKSYVTGMAHLLYSHVYDAVTGEAEGGRTEALKTVAGLMVGASLFAGVQRGFGIEPLRAIVYAYNKLVGDNDQYHDFDNMSRRAVHALAGDGKVADVINGGLPRAFGFDMSSRMGLSDLILHDPPDFLSMDKGDFAKFGFAQLGPVAEMMADQSSRLNTAFTTGRFDDLANIIPIKLVHNVFDAYKAGTVGKQTSTGATVTEPSAGAALSHLIGFRTAEEARIAEKAETDRDYKSFANNKKYALVAAYAKLPPSERAAFFADKIKQWNIDNPGHKISWSDLRKQSRSIIMTERAAKGLPSRDPVQNELNDY